MLTDVVQYLGSIRLSRKRVLFSLLVLTVNAVIWQWHITHRSDELTKNSRSVSDKAGKLLPLHSTTPYEIHHMISAQCSGLINRKVVNKTYLDLFQKNSQASNTALSPQERLRILVRDCPELKRQHGYYRWPVTPQEERFPLSFSFKLHNSPEMFERLLRVLWRPHNLYVIHVDRKAPPDVFQLIKDIAACFDNLVLIENRIEVVYASILSLMADIECVKVALKSKIQWKYHLIMSGQEFPLKTNLEIVQILSMMNVTSDIENYPPTSVFIKVLTYKSRIVNGVNSLSMVKQTSFKHPEVVIRKGSAYISASREFFEWVFQDRVSQDFLLWLNETWAPDELFWATAGYRSDAVGGVHADVRHDAQTHLSRAVAWTGDPYKCHGIYIRSICIFTILDLPWLLKRPELIANKFNGTTDPLLLDCLERHLEEKAEQGFREVTKATSAGSLETPLASTLNWTFYRALPHLKLSKVQ